MSVFMVPARLTVRMLAPLVLLLVVGTAVFAQNTDFSFSSFPVEGGARNTAGVRFHWSDSFSSSFSGSVENTALASELDGFPDSLLYTEQRTIDLDLQLLTYARRLGQLNVGIGAGAALNQQEVLERGNFIFNVPQVFRNQYTATRIGPLIAGELSAGMHPVRISYRTEVVPLYVFILAQDIEISPLVAEGSSRDTRASGGFAWDQNIRINLWTHVEIELDYGLDRLQLEVLGLGSDDSGFIFEPEKLDVLFQTFRILGNAIVPVGNGSQISVGAGYEWKTTDLQSSQDSDPTRSGRWLWKVELGW